MRLPRPSVNVTRSTIRGPPFAVDHGSRSAITYARVIRLGGTDRGSNRGAGPKIGHRATRAGACDWCGVGRTWADARSSFGWSPCAGEFCRLSASPINLPAISAARDGRTATSERRSGRAARGCDGCDGLQCTHTQQGRRPRARSAAAAAGRRVHNNQHCTTLAGTNQSSAGAGRGAKARVHYRLVEPCARAPSSSRKRSFSRFQRES